MTKPKVGRLRQSFSYALLLMVFGLGAWAFLIEPRWFYHIKHYNIYLQDWPTEMDGLRIAVLADLHIGSPHNGLDKLDELIRLTNAEKPDLILLAGDFVIQGVLGGEFVSPAKIATELANLRATLGVYAVLGNHDYWHGAEEVTQAMVQVGIPVLINKEKSIAFNRAKFWLIGIDDFWEGQPDIKGTIDRIPDARPIIAFTHNPDLFVNIPKRIGLTIAGHTHGGQVYFPLFGRPIVPSKYGERFAIGSIFEAGRHLFVNPGTGTSILPVRFLVPPEVSILNIYRAATK